MKRLTTLMIIVIGLITFGCSEEGPIGPQGPQGPQGPEGPQGPAGESGYIFEFEDINFTSPEYEVFLVYPNDFPTFESDVALVYLHWGVAMVDGDPLDIWRQLPQTIIDERGTWMYNYDFTLDDVRLFLEASFNLDNLLPEETDNKIARVVVVPGDFWASGRIMDGQIDYYDLIEALNLKDSPINGKVIVNR